MKIVMHRPDGSVFVEERAAPAAPCGPRHLRVRSAFGWISSGTEGGFLRRMRAAPSPKPECFHLGYTASGIVEEAGPEASGWKPGMRAALYGSPYVCHATEQAIGRNLAAPVPENIPLWAASSVGLGAIALHGLRQIEVTLGDVVVLLGLGPLGMLAGQLAEAMGAEVLAVDLLESRVKVFNELLPGRAHHAGVADLKDLVRSKTRGRGADALVFATSAARAGGEDLSDLLRDRGRVSLLGGGEFPNWPSAWIKELEFKQVRAGGPGRRDAGYEVEGTDYPIGYVPWTENRNMEAYLRMLATGRVRVEPLVSHCFPLDRAPEAWDLVVEHPERTLGVLIDLDPGRHETPPVRGEM